MRYALVIFIATSAVSAFGALGSSFDHVIADHANAEATPATSMRHTATPSAPPAVGSRAEALTGSGLLRAIGQRARAVFQSAQLDTSLAAQDAARYGISALTARAIEADPATRALAANTPLHRGEVVFEAPDGRTFKLYRPVASGQDVRAPWALVDIDNVIADFTGGFGDETQSLTGLPRSTFARNNADYDMREFVQAVQDHLRREASPTAGSQRFRDWLTARGQLQSFLETPATARANFSLMHRYFVEQGLYARLPLLSGARDGVHLLHQQWPIRVVTKRYGTGPDFSHVDRSVPADSAAWVSRALGGSYDSVVVMGGDKADFAGNVFAVFEDSTENIAQIRAANAAPELRERAFAQGVRAEDLDAYLARNNADVLGIAFRWNYNKDASIVEAMNVVAVDSWSDAVAVAMAHRKLLTDPEAGASGRLHWSDVPGLVNPDGTAVALPRSSIRPD